VARFLREVLAGAPAGQCSAFCTVRGNEFKAEFAATCVKLQVIGSGPHAGHDLAWLTDRTVVVGTGDSECVKHIVENTASFVSIR
jgi:hypothetical protein